jgi:hypothetical protein
VSGEWEWGGKTRKGNPTNNSSFALFYLFVNLSILPPIRAASF